MSRKMKNPKPFLNLKVCKYNFNEDKQDKHEIHQIVKLKGGKLEVFRVLGNRKDLIECREKQHQDLCAKFERQMVFKEIKRHYQNYFNKKSNKFSRKHIDHFSNLLSKTNKEYLRTRKNENLSTPPLIPQKLPNMKNKDIFPLTNIMNKNNSIFNNDIGNISIELDKEKKRFKLTARTQSQDDIFEEFDEEEYYNKGKIFKRLRKVNNFFPSIKNEKNKFFINKDKRYCCSEKKFQIETVLQTISRYKEKCIMKMKKDLIYSKSCRDFILNRRLRGDFFKRRGLSPEITILNSILQ